MAYERPFRLTSNSIGSVDGLCGALGVQEDTLEAALWLEDKYRYKSKRIPKADGTYRVVFSPCRLIRGIQKRINLRIFRATNLVSWPTFIFGSLPNQDKGGLQDNRDYIACARRHSGAKSILKVDIKDFFDNITQELVEEIFREVFKYPPKVCEALSNICCYEGRVVQGALTSSYLACLCLHDVEGKTVNRLENKRLTYSRYVDDITISSRDPSANFEFALSIIKAMVESKDLPLNSAKTVIHRISSAPLVVHGLRISTLQPRLQVDEIGRIRASVRRVEKLATEANYRTSYGYRRDFNKCMGRVNKLSRVGHAQHRSLVKRLNAIQPLPSKRDIARIDGMVERLDRDFSSNRSNTYWYKARFYRAHERINILKRTFVHEADAFRQRLKGLRPT